ncbi:hypothetical protein PT300_10545 [Enterobacteriaceae bacterium ESL0689]|nr:hypothetical protein [Enterobacteriaceae bacterium ESL0689]
MMLFIVSGTDTDLKVDIIVLAPLTLITVTASLLSATSKIWPGSSSTGLLWRHLSG